MAPLAAVAAHALHALELRDLCGIGPSMEARLQRAGIDTVEHLCSASRDQLRRAWGSIEGERFWLQLQGFDVPERVTRRASIGHSHVLGPELRNFEGARSVLFKLLAIGQGGITSVQRWWLNDTEVNVVDGSVTGIAGGLEGPNYGGNVDLRWRSGARGFPLSSTTCARPSSASRAVRRCWWARCCCRRAIRLPRPG